MKNLHFQANLYPNKYEILPEIRTKLTLNLLNDIFIKLIF